MLTDINHICFIVPNYPTNDEPVYTFVKQLVCSIADLGIKCSVIAPQSITKIWIRKKRTRPYFWQDTTDENKKVDIYQPTYISFSNLKIFGMSISNLLSQRAIINTFKKIRINPDVIYGHFWHCGVTAGIIGNEYNFPFFVATGESKIWVKQLYKEKTIYKSLKNVSGVVSVSTKNMQESIDLKLSSKEKMIVIPNAINNKLFYSIDKYEARKKLGFKDDEFIVAYTGAFTHRKGIMRLFEAIKKIDGVKAIFIGSGDLKPSGKEIIFTGCLAHDQIVNYLNAADIFVLPTLAEGCSNAIIEAMACGLPIISSNLPFNDDILDNKNSIRVDSNSVDQIATAIQYLRVNPGIREKMAKASLLKARDLEINNRAKKIIEFIRNNVK